MRYAFRSLAAAPAFSAGAIVCLAVGLTLTIGAFSVINAVLFRSMPGIHDQGALRRISTGVTGRFGPEPRPVSLADYERYRDALAPVAGVAASMERPVAIQVDGAPQASRAVFASPNYFTVLGTVPAAGALPAGSETDAAFISDRFWRAHMGARLDAIGAVIRVNGKPFRVVGVAPPKFAGAATGEFEDDPSRIVSVWLPIAAFRHSAETVVLLGRGASEPSVSSGVLVTMTARLAPGASEEELQARASGVAASLGGFARVRGIHQTNDPSELIIGLSAVLAVPLGILAIACANVANLLLARGVARSRDIAVRLALGASKGRIVGELLAESTLLALAAAGLAVVLCYVATRAVESWLPVPVAVDWRVAMFAVAAAGGTALAFGLLPAITSARTGMTLRMHDARPMRTGTRRALAGLQLALSTTLLVIAALMMRTVVELTTFGAADEPRVVAMTVNPRLAEYNRPTAEAFIGALVERTRTLPGVEAAGVSTDAPFRRRGGLVLWRPEDPRERRRFLDAGVISEGWLEAAGVHLVAGRDFTPAERRGAPTAVLVNEQAAKRLWPDNSPLGRALVVRDPYVAGAPTFDVVVIGIVRDTRRRAVDRDVAPLGYLPVAVSYSPTTTLWVRTSADGDALGPSLRAAVAQLGPGVPITDLTTVAEARRRDAGPYWWLARALGAAGTLALALAAFGLFSLLTYLVTQRRRELGIRMALGARREDIARLVIGESALVAIAGAVIGGIAAVGIALGLGDLFAGVGAVDPVAYAMAAGVLVLAALAASAHPALRASRTDPASVLRAE